MTKIHIFVFMIGIVFVILTLVGVMGDVVKKVQVYRFAHKLEGITEGYNNTAVGNVGFREY